MAAWPDGARAVASSSGSDADALVPRSSEHHPGVAVDGNENSTWATGSPGSPLSQWWGSPAGPADGSRPDSPCCSPTWTSTGRWSPSSPCGPHAGLGDGPGPRRPSAGRRLACRGPYPVGADLGGRQRGVGDRPGPWGLAEVEVAGGAVTPGGPRCRGGTRHRRWWDRRQPGACGGRAGGVRADPRARGVHFRPGPAGRRVGAFEVRETGALFRPRPVGHRAGDRFGAALDTLLDRLQLARLRLTATSRLTDEPARRPGAVADGDSATGWVASPADENPALT